MTTNRSAIFSKYNNLKGRIAKHAATQSNPDAWKSAQIARLNKALGIALSPKRYELKKQEYHFSGKSCGCQDATWRQEYVCKHRLAEVLTK
jgi:hypothetical protein